MKARIWKDRVTGLWHFRVPGYGPHPSREGARYDWSASMAAVLAEIGRRRIGVRCAARM